MAIPPFVPNVAKVLLRYAAPGIAEAITRLFFSWTNSISNSNSNAWCQSVANNWATNIAPLVPPALVLNAVTLEDLSQGSSVAGAWAGTKPGTRSGGEYGPAECFIIENLIGRKYRGGHSRNYLPGLDIGQASAVDGNAWNTTYAGTVLSAWQAFLSAISGSNGPAGSTPFTHVSVPMYKGFKAVQNPLTGRYRNVPTYAPEPITPDVIVGTAYNVNFGSQRRRNRTGG